MLALVAFVATLPSLLGLDSMAVLAVFGIVVAAFWCKAQQPPDLRGPGYARWHSAWHFLIAVGQVVISASAQHAPHAQLGACLAVDRQAAG